MAKKNRHKTQDTRHNPSAVKVTAPPVTLSGSEGHTTQLLSSRAEPKETVQPTTTGVVILALGHAYYGQMAANLAASIRFGDRDIPIHLVYAGDALNHLAPDKLALFTSMRELEKEYYHRNGKKSYVKAKTHLYELTPFDRTLYMDADMLWLSGKRPIAQALALLKEVPFTIQNRSYVDMATELGEHAYFWANANEVKAAYNLTEGKLYGLNAEVIWFAKCSANAAYFAKVREVFDNPLALPREWAGDIPDEYAFAIASAILGHYPHQNPFVIAYWYIEDAKKTVSLERITNDYWAFSAGGNNPPAKMRELYNTLALAYARGVGVQYPWKLQPKKAFIPERKIM